MEASHTSVMKSEVLEALALRPSDTVVDATLGGAGHFEALLEALGEDGVLVGIDADAAAVERAREVYARDRRSKRPVTHLINDNFRNLERILERLDIAHVDALLFDLGWSGFQVASSRGFSFQRDEPLYMTYAEGGETAADLINSLREDELADLIYTYGEERFARQIARSIVEHRAKERLLTTGALVAAIESAVPGWYRRGKIHPATKTFQAIRIGVNDELGSLTSGLTTALRVLAPGGRIAVLTFHSLEDRVVKETFRAAVEAGQGTLPTKKPGTPSKHEIHENRRARSAKLRVFVRSLSPVAVPAHESTLTYV
jgi:16S rRNA (cytosine1402-N4)-methyltransferase